ncbi:hypothetical protein GCM10027340_18600 [Marinomonas epiphytica]
MGTFIDVINSTRKKAQINRGELEIIQILGKRSTRVNGWCHADFTSCHTKWTLCQLPRTSH